MVSKTILPAILLLAFCCGDSLRGQGLTPTITPCDQSVFVTCMTEDFLDLCVTIDPRDAPLNTVDNFRIIWSTEGPLAEFDSVITDFSNLDAIQLIIDVSNVFNNGVYYNRRRLRVDVETTFLDGTDSNNGFAINLRNPPIARIGIESSIICTDQQFCITDLTSPPDSLFYTRYRFEAGQDTTSSSCHRYDLPGPRVLELFTENPCATSMARLPIEIIDRPEVRAMPDSNVMTSPAGDQFTCLRNGQSCITLNGEGTRGVSGTRWTLIEGLGADIENSTALTTRVCFTSSGPRTFTLRGDNEQCRLMDLDTVLVDVIAPPELQFQPQADACLELRYTPSPDPDPEAKYFIDGTLIDTFPFAMTPRDEPYLVRVEKGNLCATIVRRDTIFISEPIQPLLRSPTQDSAFCRDTTPEEIFLSTTGGTWQPNDALIVTDTAVYFDRNASEGNYEFFYTIGEGECRRELTVSLSILESVLELPDDFSVCSNGDPVDLDPMPPRGRLGGPGVDANAMTFDPMGLDTGIYSISYALDGTASLCPEVGSWEARVVPLPDGEAGEARSICNSDALILPDFYAPDLTFTPSNAEVRFFGMGIVDATTGAYRATNLPPGTTDTIIVTFTDTITVGACTTTDTLLLTITEFTSAQAGPDRIECAGETTINLGDPGDGHWSGDDVQDGGTLPLGGLSIGDHVYTLTKGEGPCLSVDEMTLTITPGSGISLSQPSFILCDTATVVELPEVTANRPGTWSEPLPINGNFIQTEGAAANIYIFKYTIETLPEGCNSEDFTLELLEQPTVSIQGDSIGCLNGDCSVFRAEGEHAQAFSWRTGDGETREGDSICYPYGAALDYTLTATSRRFHPVSGAALCQSDPAEIGIRVLDLPEQALIGTTQDSLCPGEPVELNFTASPSASRESLAYEWSYGNTTFNVTGDTVITLPSPLEDTTYTLSLTSLGTCGSAQDNVVLVLRANAVASAMAVDTTLCSGQKL